MRTAALITFYFVSATAHLRSALNRSCYRPHLDTNRYPRVARTMTVLLFTLMSPYIEAEEVPAPSASSSTISSAVSLSGPFNAHLTASDGSGQIRILTPSKEMTGKPTDCTTASKIFTLPVGAKVKANGDWSKLALKKEDEKIKEPPFPPIFKLKKGSVYFSCISRAENQNVRYVIRTRVMLSGVKG